ncbi:MAG: hypothetical protein HYW49_06435 [Deltaproteobacteria bacterium]|nr:hypothetical protein [Deltaproteobacteria bacterium]
MKKRHAYDAVLAFLALGLASALTACQSDNTGSGTASSSSTASTTTSSSTTSVGYTGINAFQIIPKGDSTGSFDLATNTGTAVKAQRLYNLDGSQIASGNIPAWFSEARVFITSTRTSGGTPGYTGGDTGCAYFDTTSTDNNPDASAFYTIDGYNGTATVADVDQCAGASASELNKLGLYVQIDRRFMNSTDKLQVIVKAKPIDAPNTAPSASSCVVGGYFDAGNCSNQYFTLTMRSAPYASAAPFYVLFPSAKATDLLSESVLLPIQIDTSITAISIDRVKGGAIFYGVTVVRLP